MRFAHFSDRSGIVLALLLLAGCAKQDLDEPPVNLGPFLLGHNIVVTENMQKVPISRNATGEEWESGLKKAIEDRFGKSRYDGGRYYNIGINIDGYALAPPGIPVVAAPKSVVVVSANIWDDASQTRLNPEPRQLTIFENLSGESVIGTGLTSTKKQQIAALSYNVAKAVEGWFLDNPQWFDAAGAVPGAASDATTPAPLPRVVSGQAEAVVPVPIDTGPMPDPVPGVSSIRPVPRPATLGLPTP